MFEDLEKVLAAIQRLKAAHILLEKVYLQLEYKKPLESWLIDEINEYFDHDDSE